MVYRIFVEKKSGLDNEARGLMSDINELLGIREVNKVRIWNRYDVDRIEKDVFDYAVKTVFSEPQLDIATVEINIEDAALSFAVEYLPGQFDQRASSAEECIQIISKGKRPLVKSAKVYAIYGNVTEKEAETIRKHLINTVEAREASMGMPETLEIEYELPDMVEILSGFRRLDEKGLEDFIVSRGLAMDVEDITLCQEYFKSENRDPSITEIKMIDTYWSDHCRHTTFNTQIDSIMFEDENIQNTYENYLRLRENLGRTKPVTLMDIATIAAKELKKAGKLENLDESDEINACTIKVKAEIEGKTEDWLLLFKNETHNHPTEIEPFGGAATCIGGAIRDPLSGRSYVYTAMRVTGAGNPLTPISETIEGKLPQRTIVKTAAKGYSSYGNQIGLATGQVDELYHPGYTAKRMEIGAVIGAAPAENVVRQAPEPGDIVILLGGKTGRDGCGGATGSSKSHTMSSLESCGAEVQKGNAPEERKLQRLFRNKEASRLIKRCNDFGAGGVSVAIGELAAGLEIDLDKVPKKYEGLDGTELAISESQERMAVVVKKEDVPRFKELATLENLQAEVVARVTEDPRLVMFWRGKVIVNLSRAFLDSNGAEKHINVLVKKQEKYRSSFSEIAKESSFADTMKALVSDLNICSKRGLAENFDSTIGAGTVLMPFGGLEQKTPIQAMVNKLPVEKKNCETVSLMAWGYNPYIMEQNQYEGAYLAVVESVSKLIAHGASFSEIYLSFQEYFERLGADKEKWGKPLAALLGALKAQRDLGVAAIGGKDSMSGTFESISVPPTLVSFAVTTDNIENIISPEFKAINRNIYMLKPAYERKGGIPIAESLKELYRQLHKLIVSRKVISCYTLGFGGAAEAVYKMAIGNEIGVDITDNITLEGLFDYSYGSFIVEAETNLMAEFNEGSGIEVIHLGRTKQERELSYGKEAISLEELSELYEGKLESVYPMKAAVKEDTQVPELWSQQGEIRNSIIKAGRPRVLIPVFPGTNCEYDSARAFEEAGAEAEIFVINNLNPSAVSQSVEDFAKKVTQSQIIFIPGGFSGGDEPDGSGKLITAFFRNSEIKEAVADLLEKRDGLMAGICNGFQALIKLGLVPYGKIIDTDDSCPTLTYNRIGRHQSKLVRTRIVSNKSPWLSNTEIGEIYTVPISHGEGRFLASEEEVKELADRGQIITQYVDLHGNATMDIQYNPNGSIWGIEGIISPDGRILGKMGHSERIGKGLYKNVPGYFDMKLFSSAVKYFK